MVMRPFHAEPVTGRSKRCGKTPAMLTVHVLGPVEVRRDGRPLDLGGPQQRAVIAHLALDAGRVVSVERLIDRLWGESPPRTPLGTLQSYVSRLRRVVEPAREAGGAPRVLVSEAPGYVLQVPTEQVDVHRFRSLVAEGRAVATADPAAAVARFDEALALWRGPAFAGVGPDETVRPIVVRLDEEHAAAIEDRFDALLALGRHGEVIPALQQAVVDQPLREGLWAQLALALYRCSRQADALRALASARDTLLEELGLDPGPELRELEARILDHDPALLTPATHVVAAPVVVVAPDVPRVELVGRDREWRTLTAVLERATASGAQLALVEGEPGIGKSTVCDALTAHARSAGWLVARGRCVEPGLAPSLWPAAEVVRELIEAAGSAVDEIGELPLYRFVTERTLAGGPSSTVELADQFVGLLDLVAGRPALLFVDDLHWADQATLDVMTLALERLGPRPVLVLASFRPPESVPGSLLVEALGGLVRAVPSTRVVMSPLSAAEVAQLMEITTGAAPSAEVVGRVHDRAGGNPLFVTELARLAGERGLAEGDEVPAAIRDVVRGRLAQLPERATAELQVAAVLGERFDLRTVMAASERDPDDCLDALDAAIVTRILVPEGDGFRFAHALVRDAVLADVTNLRRARLHARAAEAILAVRGDGPDETEPIAYHRLAALSVTDPVVVARAAVRASDVARWRNAIETAVWFAEQAVEVLASTNRSPEAHGLEVEALEAIIGAAYRQTGDQDFETLADRVDEFAVRARSDSAAALALFLRWGAVDETDDLDSIEAATEQARAIAERAVDGYAIVTANYMLASYAILRGRVAEARRLSDVALAAADTPDPDQRPEHVPLVLLPVVAGIIAAVQGDAATAREHAYRRTAAWLSDRAEVDRSAHLTLSFNRAFVEALLGEPDAVVRELAELPAVGGPGMFAHQDLATEVLRSWAVARTADPVAAAAAADAAFTAAAGIAESAERTLTGALLAFAADALLAVGDERAVGLLDTARTEAEGRGEVWWLSEIVRLRAAAERAFGDPARAELLLDEAAVIAAEQGAGVVEQRIVADRAALGVG